MQTTDNGTYLEVDGRPAVRFERIYPSPSSGLGGVTDPARWHCPSPR